MALRVPRRLWWQILCIVLVWSSSANAWVETAVRGHSARVEVEKDGRATIRHELLLKLRGGPMEALEIGGIGLGIEPLPDAVVRRAMEGSSGAWPLTVSSMEDGSVRLKINAERGIRGGSYLFQFAYRVDLRNGDQLRFTQEGAVVSFIGPRLTSGVDSAKVTFAFPRGSSAPRIYEGDTSGAGVLLGEVRRGAETDEIELIRAHLAVGEPAVWSAVVGSDVLSEVSPPEEEQLQSSEKPGGLLGGARGAPEDGIRLQHLLVLIALSVGLFGLVYWKARVTLAMALAREARVKPLLPSPPLLRAALCGAGLFVAGTLAVRQEPWWGVGVLVFVTALGTHLLPVRIPKPRGPGVWEHVVIESAGRTSRLSEKWFETRTLPGFGLFAILSTSVLFASYRTLPSSNYFALMIVALLIVLLPLFWTGRLLDLPQSAVFQARPWLRFVQRALDPEVARVELWGRRAGLGHEPTSDVPPSYDETRLRLVMTAPPQGLRAFEVSFEEAAGSYVLPCVVLRVIEDSPTLRALPTDIPWQRGRSPEERVAVLRPSAPTPAQLLRLLRSLLTNLRGVTRQSARSEFKSGGRSELASNGPMPSAVPPM